MNNFFKIQINSILRTQISNNIIIDFIVRSNKQYITKEIIMKSTQSLALTIIINFTIEKGWYHGGISFIQQFLFSTQQIFFNIFPQQNFKSAAGWYILLIFNNV